MRTRLAVAGWSHAEVELPGGLTADGAVGVTEPWDAVRQMRYAVLQGPDGGTVDLFSPLAG